MKILFTHRSKLIASVLDEPVTHVVIQYKDYVVHAAALGGLQITPIEEFIASGSKVVYEIEIEEDLDKLFRLFASHYSASYDFSAALYIGLYFQARRIGIRLPHKNIWQSSGMFICTEWVTEYIDENVDSMITPFGLYKKLLSQGV